MVIKQKIATVNIESLSSDGFGMAQLVSDDGTSAPIEVPFTTPGDLVEVSFKRKRKGRYQGTLERIVSPSANRASPKCIHFAECGGCRFQHLPYHEQLKFKEQLVKKAFEGIVDPAVFQPILPSKKQWCYRNKMEFSFSSNKAGEHFLGLMMAQGRGKVVNLSECHLVTPWFTQTLSAVRLWWDKTDLLSYHHYRDAGALRTLTMREGQTTKDRMVMLTVSGNPEFALKKEHLKTFVETVRGASEGVENLSIFLRIHQAIKGRPTQFFEMHLDGPDHINEQLLVQSKLNMPKRVLTFKISPVAFFQPNTLQAEVLYSKALQLAEIQKEDVVYDLYCGTGTLGITASIYAKEVIGIELSSEAALDAKENARINGCDNVTILTGLVEEQLKKIVEEKEYPLPDIVMVDPPRAGLDPSSIKDLVRLRPKKIVYVSCNPKTQAENVATLKEDGYDVSSVQPVDQFPQTIHIENIVVLERRK